MGIVGTTWALSELGSDRTDLSDLGAVTAYQRETVGGGERRRGGGGVSHREIAETIRQKEGGEMN